MKNLYFNYNLTNKHKKSDETLSNSIANKQILLLEYYSRQCKDSYFFTYIQLCAALNYLRYIYNKVYNRIQTTFKRYSNAA